MAAGSARGSADFELDLNAISRRILGEASEVMVGGAYTADRVAKQNARVDTGQMRAATHTRIVSPYEAWVYNDVEHSLPNEFGHDSDPGQPFMRPGMRAGADHIDAEIARRFR